MSTKKISALATGATANASDKLPIERSGANYYITPAMLSTYIGGALTSTVGLVARYHLSAAVSYTSGTTTIINFNTADLSNAAVATGASWAFTAPATAWYEVKIVQGLVDPNGTVWTAADPYGVKLYKGGVDQGFVAYDEAGVTTTTTDHWPFLHGSKAISLTATNTIDLRFFNQSGQTRKLDINAAIEIYRVT